MPIPTRKEPDGGFVLVPPSKSPSKLVYPQSIKEMMVEAAQLGAFETRHKVVTRVVNGRCVTCIGRRAERNTRDGFYPVLVLRWRMDGKPATKLAVVQAFEVDTNIARAAALKEHA